MISQVKGFVGQTCHIEVKRGTPQQARDYCKKEDVFFEFGVRPSDGGVRDVFRRFQVWVEEYIVNHRNGPSERQVAQMWEGIYIRNSMSVMNFVHLMSPLVTFDVDLQLMPWQQSLKDTINLPADDRRVIFIVNFDGGAGKTWFQRYYYTLHMDDVQVLSSSKHNDIAHAVDENKSVFFFNIPREGMEYLPYTTLEMIKDKMIFSPKYNSTTKMFKKNNHVVVFCNEIPDMGKMSANLYIVF